MHANRGVLSLAVLALAMTACSKQPETTTDAPAATPDTGAAQVSVSASSTVVSEAPDMAAKRKAIDFAMLEDSIKNDAQGQWAASARASSTFAGDGADNKAGYHPFRATGAPDTEHYGDTSTSWATKTSDGGIEWLELEYTKPINATEVRVRQNNAPGAIVKVELFDDKGAAHTVWQGPDATVYPANEIAWLNARFDKTTYKTQKLKITLATNAVSGWNEIDAVQLVGE